MKENLHVSKCCQSIVVLLSVILVIYPFGTDNSKTAVTLKFVIDSLLDNAQQPMITGKL